MNSIIVPVQFWNRYYDSKHGYIVGIGTEFADWCRSHLGSYRLEWDDDNLDLYLYASDDDLVLVKMIF